MPPHVKTSLAPGSRVVTDYFEKAGLDKYLEKVGFYTVGYGCTTCIGNSGPLPEPISQAVKKNDLVVAGVLSRQSQLRGPHQSGREGQLPGQPAAGRGLRAGRHDRHRLRERADRHRQRRRAGVPAATSGRRTPKCRRSIDKCVLPEMFEKQYDDVWEKNPKWNAIKTSEGELYEWDADEHLHPGAAVPGRPARRSRDRSSRSAARAAWRRSATR